MKVGSSPYPATSTGHELTIDNVELYMYLKALESADGITLTAESKDKKYLSIKKKEESDSIKSQLSSSQENDKCINNKQNMSLPPHWRRNQPIQREDSDDDEETEKVVDDPIFKATNKNMKKLTISDLISDTLDHDNVGLEVD